MSYDTDDERMRSVAGRNYGNPIVSTKAGLQPGQATAVVFDMSNLFNGSDSSTSLIQEGGFPILLRAPPTSPPWIFTMSSRSRTTSPSRLR